jgi:predicted RNA-binding Zn-ribbon protein involved in translation (DUF1610 family)
MSYATCECGTKAPFDEKTRKYICPKCGKEVKPRSLIWGK